MRSTITCPNCGHQKVEEIPTDSCLFFYECEGCGKLLRPEEGDCCVFCSFGDRACTSAADRGAEGADPGGEPRATSTEITPRRHRRP